MIFVTVGTHEQQFNRMISCIDELKKRKKITEEVICQIGFCTYIPQYCTWEKIIPYEEMKKNILEARIVITHGGPASFIMPLQWGKIPIVVPRRAEFEEHVNNHQVEFIQAVSERMGNIIPIYDIENLGDAIEHYYDISSSMKAKISSNNKQFNQKLEKIVEGLF